MPEVIVVDTTVLLNVLDVPGRNQHRDDVLERFGEVTEGGASLLLPMAAVYEAGNHIAKLADGHQRRRFAGIFCDQVRGALNGEAPWVLVPLPNSDQLAKWLEDFPDCAMREVGMSDLSMIKAWEEACSRNPSRRVRIWSLDAGLQGYDRRP